MKRFLLLAVACTILAGCGAATRTLTRTVTAPTLTTTTTTVAGCAAGQATMNCVLSTLPPPASGLGAAPGVQGVDFGWGSVSPADAKAAGARFAASYLSTDQSKNWTPALVDAYHQAGLATVAVWETYATRAEAGYAAGVADARQARAQAAAIGDTARPILFAVDCDCAGAQILPYFRGAHSVLGARTDAYGGRTQLLYLSQHGVVGHENWQTYAWSGGAWLPASIAPLEQYLNGPVYDRDRAIGNPFAQWPLPKPPAPPVIRSGARHWGWLPTTIRHFGKAAAGERQTVRSWDQNRCMNPVARPVCRTARADMLLLEHRLAVIAARVRPRWRAVHYQTPGHTTTLGGAYQQFARRLSSTHHGVVTHW